MFGVNAIYYSTDGFSFLEITVLPIDYPEHLPPVFIFLLNPRYGKIRQIPISSSFLLFSATFSGVRSYSFQNIKEVIKITIAGTIAE